MWYLIVSIPDLCNLTYLEAATNLIIFDNTARKFIIPDPEVIKLFFMLNSAEHEIYPANKC